MRWVRHVARMGEKRGVYIVLMGKPEGKRPLGRPRRKWDNTKMYLKEIGCDRMEWLNMARSRQVVSCCVLYSVGHF
jgi:hypothetical protein